MADTTHMSPKDAFMEVARTSPISMRQISLNMGHRAEYISVIIAKSKIPRIDTFAKVADASGWDIVARKRDNGSEIYIDPGPAESG